MDIGLDIGGKRKPSSAKKAVGRRPKAQILRKIPILSVVPGTKARPGEIGNFILFKSRRRQPLDGAEIHFRLDVVVRQGRVPLIQRRPLFQLQRIGRKMLGRQRRDFINRFFPFSHGLARQAIHHIQRYIVKPHVLGLFHRLSSLVEGMQSPQSLQFVVVRALHAEGKPIDPGPLQLLEQLGVCALRVAFHRNLRIFADRRAFFQGGEQPCQPLASHQRRGAAAEINRVDLKGVLFAEILLKMGFHCLAIIVHQLAVFAPAGIKITIGALLPAKRHMDVNT